MNPKKSLGQNFLSDVETARVVVTSAGLKTGDAVLEIGPGRGFLTRALLESGAKVTAVELDRDLIQPLQERFGTLPLTVLHQDVLALDLSTLDLPICPVVGNLPYNQASAILRKMLEAGERFSRMVFMFQLEVAQRLCAKGGDDAFGIPSVRVALTHRATMVRKISPGSFFPKPKVFSALVLFEPLASPLLSKQEAGPFMEFVERGFQQRRKKARNTLANPPETTPSAVEQALASLGISQDVRVEALTVAQLIALWKKLSRLP